MKKSVVALTIISWVSAVLVFINAYIHNNLVKLIPIYYHNHPQGLFGWIIVISIILTIISSQIKSHNK